MHYPLLHCPDRMMKIKSLDTDKEHPMRDGVRAKRPTNGDERVGDDVCITETWGEDVALPAPDPQGECGRSSILHGGVVTRKFGDGSMRCRRALAYSGTSQVAPRHGLNLATTPPRRLRSPVPACFITTLPHQPKPERYTAHPASSVDRGDLLAPCPYELLGPATASWLSLLSIGEVAGQSNVSGG